MRAMTLWDNPETMASLGRWAGWTSVILVVLAAIAGGATWAAQQRAANLEETLKREIPSLDASLLRQPSGKLIVIIFAKSLVPVEAHWQITSETIEPGGGSKGMAGYSATLHPRQRVNRLFYYEAANPVLPSGKQVDLGLHLQFESLYAAALGLAGLRGEQSKSYRLNPDGRLQEIISE